MSRFTICLLATVLPMPAAQQQPKAKAAVACSVDLTKPGQMADIISNGLLSLDRFDESVVAKFLSDADERYDSGDALLVAAAKEFDMERKELSDLVTRFKHVNCDHATQPTQPGTPMLRTGTRPTKTSAKVTPFAEDVVTHVVLHELGHAVIREFDLPVLGNEETMADAFATVYLTRHMPDRAAVILEARVRSLMIEAKEVPLAEWTVLGEHNSDARRAAQIAALAVAADGEKYKNVAAAAGLSERSIRNARDYGTEIHRSWRRILAPIRMPTGSQSREAKMGFEGQIGSQLKPRPVAKELETALRSFDWHSTVTIAFIDGDGGAGWSRSRRTVTVNSAYVERFIRQGQQVSKRESKPGR